MRRGSPTPRRSRRPRANLGGTGRTPTRESHNVHSRGDWSSWLNGARRAMGRSDALMKAKLSADPPEFTCPGSSHAAATPNPHP